MAERHDERGRRYPGDSREGRWRPDPEESHDRGFIDRAGDEIRSWFGDEEAEARRYRDEERERYEERGTPRREAFPSDRRWDRVPDTRFDPERGFDEAPRRGHHGSVRGRAGYQRPRAGWSEDWGNAPEGIGGAGTGWGAGTSEWYGAPGRAASMGFRGRGPRGYQRSDERIREEICERLTDDPYVDASDVEVQVRDREVVLTGSVPGRDQKRRVEDLVESMSGVIDVSNQLRTSPRIAPGGTEHQG